MLAPQRRAQILAELDRRGSVRVSELVRILGVSDMTVSKQFYVDRGLTVARSFGRKYVEFDSSTGPIKLALYGRRALAKVAGVPADGTGSHRLAIGTDAGHFTDPDGFTWEALSVPGMRRPSASGRATPQTPT